MSVIVDESLCNGCKACIPFCPNEALIMKGSVAKVIKTFCNDCGYCEHGCGEEAIRVLA
ncbi:MAG: 4Fe-4S binding protein [Thermoplasmata archaeon]|nr:MAG: 4Fe-4S binding protein [Thermoplasmata archaeon]